HRERGLPHIKILASFTRMIKQPLWTYYRVCRIDWTGKPPGANPRGRGRDADYSTPPAQIRTCAFTHTALTVDAWRQKRKSYCSPHTAQSLGHALPRSVSGTCKIERCSPQSAPFPPQPPQKVTLRCSAGSRVLRHSPTSPERSCPPFGLWPSRTGL